MEGQMNLGVVVFTIVLSFVLNGLVVLLARMVLQNAHERDIANLRQRQEIDVTQMRAEIDRAQMIQATQFTDLHKRRAEVIADLYKLLAKADKHLRSPILLTPQLKGHEIPEDERFWSSLRPKIEAVENLSDFYLENQIFLSVDQVSLMDQIIDILESVKGGTLLKQLQLHYPPKDDELKQFGIEFSEQKLSEA